MTDTGPYCNYLNPECYAKYCNEDEPMCKAIKTIGVRCRISETEGPCWLDAAGVNCVGLTFKQCDALAFKAAVSLGVVQELEGFDCVGNKDASCLTKLYEKKACEGDQTCGQQPEVKVTIPEFVCDKHDPSNPCYEPPVNVIAEEKIICKES